MHGLNPFVDARYLSRDDISGLQFLIIISARKQDFSHFLDFCVCLCNMNCEVILLTSTMLGHFFFLDFLTFRCWEQVVCAQFLFILVTVIIIFDTFRNLIYLGILRRSTPSTFLMLRQSLWLNLRLHVI